MTSEKEKTIVDFLKLVSPGSALRNVIDDLVGSNLGALIVFDSPELHPQSIIGGGFRINTKLTQQKLFELCKMDGAIIISSDQKRILYANVLLQPSPTVHTIETGTRHIAAERTSKQAKTLVIAVSERRRKTTLYHGHSRYYLRPSEEILRTLSSNLYVLEKQRELFDQQLGNINILEMSELTSISDVCRILQKGEMIRNVSDSVKKNFIELGKEGNVINMRYRELLRNVEKIEDEILRDYSPLSLKRSKNLLENLTFEGLVDLDTIARLIFEKSLDETINPQGYRFLSQLNLSKSEISQLVNQFKTLKKILEAPASDLEPILKNRASTTFQDIENLREQILSGKVIC